MTDKNRNKYNKNNDKNDKEFVIGDIIRNVITIGVGTAFMTEDAVKKMLSDLPLPKDIISGLVQNAKSAKEEFTQTLRDELRRHFNKLDPTTLITELVENYDIHIDARLKFKKKEESKSDTRKSVKNK